MDTSSRKECIKQKCRGEAMSHKELRFAPLIRVSTEQQEKKGESLRTQKEQILSYVKRLGGIIPDSCWQYSGQEHATPGQDRQLLDKLLEDSSKNIFDAIIVCDASRWSRDNKKSKEGLTILKKHKILFFAATTEYDLHSPEQALFLGLAAEINEFHAKNQNLKSIQNRIARAKRGIPTTGKLPYGRTFDSEKSIWGIDKEKAQNIKWAADQYLNHNKGIIEIAKTLRMNVSNLWKILNHRSGDTWTIEFDATSLNIKEDVTMNIPPLLTPETIKAIHERAKANKTYTHGEIKNKYLLSRMIFCEDCGNAMFGQTNRHISRYYRHARYRLDECNPKFWVRADLIEDAVFLHLFNLFGNVDGMEKAIARAIPNKARTVSLQEELKQLEPKLQLCQKEKENIVRSIAKGILTDEDAATNMRDIRESESRLTQSIFQIKLQLENVPTKERIERSATLVQNTIRKAYKGKGGIDKMTYEEKRTLLEKAFSGKDVKGKRLGVYVRKTNNPDRPIAFTVKGILGNIEGLLPLSKFDLEELIGPEDETNFALYCRAAVHP